MRFCNIHLRSILLWVSKLLFCIISSKIIFLKLLPYLPGTNGWIYYTSHQTPLRYIRQVPLYQSINANFSAHKTEPTPGSISYLLPFNTTWEWRLSTYRQVSNIRCTLSSYEIVDHSDVVGASPVGAAPTTSSFSTSHRASLDWAKTTAWRDEKQLSLVILEILWYVHFLSLSETGLTWLHIIDRKQGLDSI